MTIEETISALDIVEHMESFSVLYEPGGPMNQTTVGKLKEACRMAISILRARTDPPPNDPLTLEQLRERDGEPVWVEARVALKTEWCIVKYDHQMKRIRFWGADGGWYDSYDYGGRIIAYRRRPEEGGSVGH